MNSDPATMTDALIKLPTVILLGVLVAIFSALRRKNQTLRFRLWFLAWSLIFLRSAFQLLWQPLHVPRSFYAGLDLASLQFAAVIFMISVSEIHEESHNRIKLLLALGLPISAYAFCMAYKVHTPWAYVGLMTFMAIVPSYLLWKSTGRTPWIVFSLSAGLSLVGFSMYQALNQRNDIGFYTFMTWVLANTSLLFYRRSRRITPGVIVTCAGFAAWALISPIAYYSEYIPISHSLQTEFWNLPKFVVAIGMIVALLEEEGASAESARLRERVLYTQMRRFADLTAQLLGGKEMTTICDQIAAVITESSNYQRVVIILSDGQQKLYVAGHSGIDELSLTNIVEGLAKLRPDSVESLFQPETRIGANSFRRRTEELEPMGAVRTRLKYPENPFWREGDELLIPLRSVHGAFVGLISLDDPKQVERVTAEDISTLELLADDIAGNIETANLQKHLFHAEKLAGMGQLVGGVAHELNNPLTAILGYSEMLADRTTDPAMQRDLDIMRREALRMKRIIENLQRFSRQQKMAKKTLDVRQLIEDVIKLRTYELNTKGIRISLNATGAQSRADADESLLHQVVLNVLNNAIEAVESSDIKTISVDVGTKGSFVQIRVTDSGEGFSNIQRVFDPFFSTKAPGKGTGLGLSICYGIVKEHGGDITATNIQPRGACITILLPVQAAGPSVRAQVSTQQST